LDARKQAGLRAPVTVLGLFLLQLGFLMMAGAPNAAAQAVQDASCPGPRTVGHAGSTNGRFAQTFTAQTTGSLISAQVDVSKVDGNADWILRIVEVDATGTPTNTALATAVVPDASVPISSSVIITGTFASPASVVAGQQYALTVGRPGSGSGAVQVGGRGPGDTCPGLLFFSNTQTDPFSSAGTSDMVFAVFVEPAPPEPQAPVKADGTLTIDANKGKVEKGRKVTLTGQLDVASNESCEPNRQIQIQRRLKSEDDSKFATFETVSTTAAGNYTLKVKVKKTYFYRAVVSETDACDDETSNSQKVRVQKKKAAQEA
jgi:hypothetical protein